MIKALREQIKIEMVNKKNTGDSLRYQTLKNILEKAQKIAKEQRTETITDSMVIDASKKEIKQLKDLLEYCEKDSDRYNTTVKCVGYAEEILPKMASEDDIKKLLTDNKENINNIEQP